jgi:AAA+ superfamily predicted ATPase
MSERHSEPIINSMEVIFAEKDSLLKKQGKLKKIESAVEKVNSFLDCDPLASIVASIVICYSINGEDDICLWSIGKGIGMQTSSIVSLPKVLEPLFKKGLFQFNDISPIGNIGVSRGVIKAVLENDNQQLAGETINDAFSFLQQFNNVISEKKNFSPDKGDVFLWVTDYLSRHQYIQFVKRILKQQLNPVDTMALLYLFKAYLEGESEECITDMINRLYFNLKDQHAIRQELRQNKSRLMRKKLVQSVNPSNPLCDYIKLTPKAIKILCGNTIDFKKEERNFNICELILPDKIVNKKLVYSPEEGKQLEKIFSVLKQKEFTCAQKKLKESGLPAGITIMLHGYPGTGKTETVNQLALSCGRAIVMVEISKVRGKYVGESEKNVKAIFNEYKQAMKTQKLCPILLFNEADAILGKRREANSSADQMQNNMQNILLQELESFEGIFIATTNLISNLDFAFERRILYKIKFNKPNPESRRQILLDRFPYLDNESLYKLSRDYELSGGQIENIRKKIILEKVLRSDFKAEEDLLLQWAEQELVMSRPSRNLIGFNQN